MISIFNAQAICDSSLTALEHGVLTIITIFNYIYVFFGFVAGIVIHKIWLRKPVTE